MTQQSLSRTLRRAARYRRGPANGKPDTWTAIGCMWRRTERKFLSRASRSMQTVTSRLGSSDGHSNKTREPFVRSARPRPSCLRSSCAFNRTKEGSRSKEWRHAKSRLGSKRQSFWLVFILPHVRLSPAQVSFTLARVPELAITGRSDTRPLTGNSTGASSITYAPAGRECRRHRHCT